MLYPTKIIIADDHEIFRNGLRNLLKNQDGFELVAEARNGRELINMVTRHRPDVIITDIKMPVMDGIEASKKLRKNCPGAEIIALSMFNDENLITAMIDAGVKGYLLKNTSRQELIKAVKAVIKGESYYCKSTAIMIGQAIVNTARHRKGNPRRLTLREIKVVKLICQQYTNKEIADRLNVSVRTIESHRENILRKTMSKNMVGIALFAIKNNIYTP